MTGQSLSHIRILFMTSRDITHPQWAGGDVYHFNICKRLVQDGHPVTMLCNAYKGCKSRDIISGISVVRVKGGIFRLFSNFIDYHKLFKGKCDVIIEEAEGPAGPLFAFLYAKEPVVIMWYQLGKTIYLNQFPYLIAIMLFIMEKIYLRLSRRCLIVVLSHERAEDFVNLGISRRKLRVVPASFDFQTTLSDNARPGVEGPYFLVLGKIRRYKSYHHAIEALSVLRNWGEKCSLVIAGRSGDENYYWQLKKLILDYGLQDFVILNTDVTEREKMILLSNALALIVTSPIEGFGIVAAEASALGTPVIATNGVPSEVVKDGFNGIKYRFGDTYALAKAMQELLHNEGLRKALSRNAMSNSARFSWDISAKLFKEVLIEALQSKDEK